MKNLFHQEAYEEILHRIENLSPNSTPLWGSMTVSQTLTHCQKPILVALEKLHISKSPLLFRVLFKFLKPMLYNDKPWKQGLPTPKEFRVVDERAFSQEKESLLNLIHEFHAKKDKTDWPRHPTGVAFTPEQWGKMQYKHLDHHLRQFDV